MSALVKCPDCKTPKRIECEPGYGAAVVDPDGGWWMGGGPERVECRCGRRFYVTLMQVRR